MIGKTISHYKILEKLGEGGMGDVYKAEDTNLDRIVALKFLPMEMTRDKDMKTRFIHEAKAASALDHPNICNIHEIDETKEGQIFICMGYYKGRTVEEKTKQGPLEIDEALDITIQIAQGLDKAHKKKITHRDIKSANIIVTTDDVVKIVDFGIAKLAGQTQVTKDGASLGTVSYMSPEQTLGKEVDHRTDIWSLGVVLYEMLTGLQPFQGDYEQAVVYSIMNEEPKPPTSIRTRIPMELERIVNKTLAKDPNERYQHLDELIVDLKSATKIIDPGVRTSAVTKKEIPLKNRKPIFIGIISIILVITGLLLTKIIGPEKAINSIAILPFDNVSGDSDMEYLSDGITENLINNLSRLSNLRVMSRYAVFRYKGQEIDPQYVGRELNVRAVLLGQVLLQGENLKISLELVDTQDNRQLWGEHYDRQFDDIMVLQEEISKQILKKLQVQLNSVENDQLTKHYTENSEAYQLYLRGRYFWNTYTREGLAKSIEYFHQAIEIDPNYALAYAGLADTYSIVASWYTGSDEDMNKAEAYAKKALELDNSIAEVHYTIARKKLFYDWDWTTAGTEAVSAIKLNPNYSLGYDVYGIYLGLTGRIDEAVQQMEKAVELAPIQHHQNCNLGWIYYYSQQYDRAIEQAKKTLELEEYCSFENLWIAYAYNQKGMHEEALSELNKMDSQEENWTPRLSELAYTYALSGQKDEAQKILAKLEDVSTKRYVDPWYIASIYASLDDKDQAFIWLEKGVEERSFKSSGIKLEPKFQKLWSDARFPALLKKMGLEE
jgi:serine/threonine protein kinase/Tfp pilus assembly protein PilF